MNSSRTITLFAPPAPSRTGPSSFAVSVLTHALVLGLMFLAIQYAPRISDQPPSHRYTVRILNLHRTEPRLRWSPGHGGAQQTTQAMAHAARSGGQPAAPAAPRQLAQRLPARQTLIQPDAPANLPLLDVHVPLVVMWTPESIPTPKIIPPPPQKATAAAVRASLTAPNREQRVADIELSSSPSITETVPLVASTTSPITVRSPGLIIPQTASKSAGQPTAATVMSISDVLLAQGTVALPLASQTASASPSELLSSGHADSASDNGTTTGRQSGTGKGQNPGAAGDQESASRGSGGNNGAGMGGNNGAGMESTSGSNSGSLAGDALALDRIELPRNGQYGVVVVGASLADEYPETLGIWSGRLAYTVYLHVGLAKNWILQYSLPRVAEKAGNKARPDAPWPYLIVRPHLMPEDSDADAIMVHGFIDSGGHFEKLAVVFPPQFPQKTFVLSSLEQWRFRPAMQNGQHTPVEVLLIIPDESE